MHMPPGGGIGAAARSNERTWSVMGQPDLDGMLSMLPNNGENWIVLLNFFDFDKPGIVTQSNWQAGLIAVNMPELAADEMLWKSLLQLYADKQDSAAISLAAVKYKVAFDPIVQTLLRSMVQQSRKMRVLLDDSKSELQAFEAREQQRQEKIARDTQNILARKILMMQLRAMKPVYDAWMNLHKTSKLLRQRASRYAAQFALSHPMHVLKQMVADKQHRRRLIMILFGTRLRHGWRRWSVQIESGIERAELMGNKLKRIKRIGKRMLLLSQDRAFVAWLELRDDERRRKKAMAKVLRNAEWKALSKWMEMVEEKNRLKRLFKGAKPEGKAWRCWLEFIDEKKRSLSMLKRAVHPCNTAWSQWQEWWAERKEAMDAMKRVARRALNQPLIRALNAWLELVEERKALQRLARRAMNQPLIRALNAWAMVADEAREKKRRLGAHMRGHAQAPVKAAFMAWKFQKVAGGRVQKLVARWLGAAKARLFSRWRFYLLGESQLTKIMGKLRPHAASFHRWVAMSEEYRADMQKLRKGSARLKKRLVKQAWAQWEERVEVLRKMHRAGKKLLGDPCGKAWAQWMDLVREQHMMRRVARRAMHRGMMRAWEQWWSTMQSADEKAKLQRMARRALNKGLALGWMAWLEDYEEKCRKKDEVRPRPGTRYLLTADHDSLY